VVVFSRQELSQLKLSDFVEYYRRFPRLAWSKYPRLLAKILSQLSPRERRAMKAFEDVHRQRIADAYALHSSLARAEGDSAIPNGASYHGSSQRATTFME
jgi:hypothetical protein